MVNIFYFEKSLKLSWIKCMAKKDKTDWYKLLQISIKKPKNIFVLGGEFCTTFIQNVNPFYKMVFQYWKLYCHTKKPPATKTCYQVFYGTIVKYLKLIYFILSISWVIVSLPQMLYAIWVFDAKFRFTNHVNSAIKSCFFSLRVLHRIRRFLSIDTSVVIGNALVSSRLDYCNSLFRSLSSRNATRLQYVQNALARFVTGASKYTHITSSLRTLHWLPIRQRIIFKTLVLVYMYLTTGQPKYFGPYLSLYKSAVNTRCSNPPNLFLQVPNYCASIHKSKVHFNNSFSYDAPKLWNYLPQDIRSAANLSCFKNRLKTYFRNHFHLSL